MGSKLSDGDIQKRLDACSRHRQQPVRDAPSTPEGFWIPFFEDTQPDDDRQKTAAAAAVTVADAPIAYRLLNRQQVLDESMRF